MQARNNPGRRIFVRTDDWDEHDLMMHTLLQKMPQWGMMTSSHAILLQVNYERPSRTRIIKEPLGREHPDGAHNNTNLSVPRPRLERMRSRGLLHAAANGLLPEGRMQGKTIWA